MDRRIALVPLLILGFLSSALASKTPISSNSVLVALLDSQYSELAELVEKASMLQVLEDAVTSGTNITVFAPNNTFLERGLDPDFKRFLHEPGNVASLQRLLQFHVLPRRIAKEEWKTRVKVKSEHASLSQERLSLGMAKDGVLKVDLGVVTHPNAVVRTDGVIHGIDRVLVPKSVQDDFTAWRSSRGLLEAVKPEGAPVLDSSRQGTSKSGSSPSSDSKTFTPKHSIYYAMAPGHSLAPAPAPGPGTRRHYFDGEAQVKDFIHTLLHYGGYNEMADILVNLTSLASEMAKLVSEGYRLTLLAPNDEAMSSLTAERLSDPGAPERIVYYHMIPEYQTEESFYTAVRRFGKVKYDTLLLPYKMLSQEADGTVLFGEGDSAAHLYDHDIYTDGRISVQGIDKVLFPPEEATSSKEHASSTEKHANGRKLEEEEQTVKEGYHRGKLLDSACHFLESFKKSHLIPACSRN
eukprot:TRINITY_DN29025_c0_g1_i1.p1 TRINITY_DN29025_c0_g1~~TRINITY_DN29025_c0_g1_i1.p1  ORF type:complete len:466 (-),score=44.64 TRINITY_DN29025_c0_g1_i1:396-1793(-)